MARKRRRVNRNAENKEKVLPEPDPNSEDFIYDEVDKFHRNKDKVMLDAEKESDSSEMEETEDEEVLGVNSSSEEDDEQVDQENGEDGKYQQNENEGDIDEEDDEDSDHDNTAGLPSDQAWGKHKNAFYSADVEDADIYASDEEAEIAAQEEEIEALTLQKRMAERLDEEDFLTIDKEVVPDKDEQLSKITTDLSKLSNREKLELLNKTSPELLPLMNEYQEIVDELKQIYDPLYKKTLSGKISSKEHVQFIQEKYQFLMNYLVNISFYLALKASKEDLKNHPIYDALFQHKQLLSEMKPMHDHVVETYLSTNEGDVDEDQAIKKVEAKSRAPPSVTKHGKIEKKNIPKEKKISFESPEDDEDDDDIRDIDPLEYYNACKAQAKKRKKDLDSSNEKDDENEEVKEEVEFDEDGKRKITYEMSKNKGLTRHRRKELRNPRVKHKMKFKKAKVKRKGQVREVQKELSRYGGELTGIKSSLTRSVRIK